MKPKNIFLAFFICFIFFSAVCRAQSGVISTYAGNGTNTYPGDGFPATAVGMDVQGIALDQFGNIYLADAINNAIRKIDTSGIITTVAGNGIAGYAGDGGPAISAQLSFPVSVAIDNAGNIYIGDINNYRVRKINTAGIITTIAGTGLNSFSGDGGIGTAASITDATSIYADQFGNIYFSDAANHRIRKIDTSDIITTVAGGGASGYLGDGGPATSASLSSPYGVTIDASGDIYI